MKNKVAAGKDFAEWPEIISGIKDIKSEIDRVWSEIRIQGA